MSGLIKQVALISQTTDVTVAETQRISAALQKQVSRDFGPIWDINATVDAFATIEDVPDGYWPILIRDDIGGTGEGVHLDRNGQPYALVKSSYGTPLTCSHELLEMLVDPFGNRMISSDSIKPGQGRVRYLVEVCDPSEHSEFGYDVNGIRLSDFYTPNYFDPVETTGIRYSFTGAIKAPKQVLKYGYLSWMDPESGAWWQAKHKGVAVQFEGPFSWKREDGRSWRETVDMHTYDCRKLLCGGPLTGENNAERMFFSAANRSAANVWSAELMDDVHQILKRGKP